MSDPGREPLFYSRDVLVDTLVYHQRASIETCTCGWSVLGASHAEHVADIFEESSAAYAEDADAF